MDKRYIRSVGCVFSLKYHFVWCPKYRRKVLVGDIAQSLKTLLHKIANEHNWTIESMEIMPDHVHCFIAVTPTDSPQFVANKLKGTSSRIMREKFPVLKSRLPCLWSRSYYVGSIGFISEETAIKYIEDQKGK